MTKKVKEHEIASKENYALVMPLRMSIMMFIPLP